MSEISNRESGQVTANLEVTESKASASTNSRFAVAMDRFGGNLVGFLSDFVEGKRQENELTRIGRMTAKQLEIDAALRKVSENPELGKSLAEQFLKDQARKQINLIEVSRNAAETIKSLPPPETESTDTLDDDWLNVFQSYAEKASSDRLRQLWGNLLAGEIRKPGAFSLRTLRFLSEIDLATAKIFEKIAKSRSIDCLCIAKPEILEGQDLWEHKALHDAGLLHDASFGVVQTLTISNGCAVYHRGPKITLGALIVFVTPKPSIKALKVNLIPFTQIGQEVCQLLPEIDGLVHLRAVASQLKNQAELIDICKVTMVSEISFSSTTIEKII